MRKFVLVTVMCLIVSPSFSNGKERDSLNHNISGIVPLPILMYSPETKIGVGAAVSYFFRKVGSGPAGRPSLIMPSIVYTQKKQIISDIYADLYRKNEMYHLVGYLGYKKFPDKFYGIGNNTTKADEETYTPQIFRLAIGLQRKIYAGLNIGLQYEWEYHKIVERENDGLLAAGAVPGSTGGYISGIGFIASWDTRSNIFYPKSGNYFQVYAGLFSQFLGSDYSYKRYTLDIRRYISLSSFLVLALQGYMNVNAGELPFQKLSMLAGRIDGQNLMRGYYEGRYRDKNMIVFQMEYRLMPLWPRFGLVVFAGYGDVADKMANFDLQNFKYSIGAGIRFLVIREEKLNIRLDFAYGKQSTGMYITIGEAL